MLSKTLKTQRTDHRTFVFELTPDCNQDCIFCYNVWKYHDYPFQRISLDQWKEIILSLKAQTRIKTVSLSGGEPLLYPDLVELVSFLKNQNISITLITNAAAMTKEKAQLLVDAGVSLFEVSLTAPNKVLHQELKGTDDFEQVVRGVSAIKSAGGRIVTVFIATKDSLAFLPQTLELGIVLGSKATMINRINPAHQKHIALMPSIEQLHETYTYLNEFSRKYSYPVASTIPVQPCLINVKSFPHISSGYCPHEDKNMYLTVDYAGNVRTCNHSPTILGSLLETHLSEITNNPRLECFKKALPSSCSGCSHARVCRGGCNASAEVCNGSITEMDPFLRQNIKQKRKI